MYKAIVTPQHVQKRRVWFLARGPLGDHRILIRIGPENQSVVLSQIIPLMCAEQRKQDQ
jgi:hypothetical protein